jgi:hypothetical protein
MAHNQNHENIEASIAKAQSASNKTYNDLKNGPAKPVTPNETQNLRSDPAFSTAYKGSLTRCEIYERLMPDGSTGALRIDGPCIPKAPGSGGFISLLSDGGIVLRTGDKSNEAGPASGLLSIHTEGQQQYHGGRTDIEYNDGGPESEGHALNVVAYGDVVENAIGSERVVKAKKIKIEATEELWLIGKTQVYIQAGSGGGGTISMVAGNIEKYTDNDKEIILGQKMVFGVSEDMMMQFDPRANVVINSPGFHNVNVLGATKYKIGGAVDWKVGGAYNMDTTGAYLNKVGGAATSTAGGAITSAAGGASTITASGVMTVAASGAMTIAGGAAVTMSAVGNVTITGALILLN